MKKIISVTLLLLAIIAYACKKNFTDKEPPPSADFDVAAAKAYYQSLVSRKTGKSVMSNSVKTIKDGQTIFDLLWKKAYKSIYKGSVEYVEVPLITSKRTIALYHFPVDNIKLKADESVLSSVFQRMVFYKYKNGQTSKRLLTYIPDRQYLLDHPGEAPLNNLSALRKDFFGYIEYMDWYGKNVLIVRIENGKAVRRYKKADSSALSSKSIKGKGNKVNSLVCEIICTPVYELICKHDDNYPPDVYAVVCSNTIVDLECAEYCTEVPDPDPCPMGNCDDPDPDPDPEEDYYDCAGVLNGTAVESCCGCIGGETGIADCSELSDDPNLTPSATISEVSPSAASVALLGDNWGLAIDESVDIEIGASISNCVWTAVLQTVKGNYSVQARLVSGCSEVGGTNAGNYCAQVFDLKNFGAARQWYMLSAVQAHENVHVTHLLPSLNSALSNMKSMVSSLSVPATGQTKAQAITQLENLSGFQTVITNAKNIWHNAYVTYAQFDHLGATNLAETVIVHPMGIYICNLKTSNPSWPACSFCPFF